MTEARKAIVLGNTVKDAISGFTGVAIHNVHYLNGNVMWAIQPVMAEGEKTLPDPVMFDYHTLDYVDDGIVARVTPCVDDVDFKLGDLVEDKATGFRGIATQRCYYINGCVRYGVLPKSVKTDLLNDNSRESFIENYRLKRVGDGLNAPAAVPVIPQPAPAGKAPGGPNIKLKREAVRRG